MKKRGLKLFCAFLALLMTLLILPANATAFEDPAYYGKCGDNVTWELYMASGRLVISGTGDMWDYTGYTDSMAPWRPNIYAAEIRSITISEGVTSIGNDAFSTCFNLPEITIPSTVTRIGNNAFNTWCQSLKKVTFAPNSQLKTIGENAFMYCIALEEITIPSSVTTIGQSAFNSCEILTNVTFEEGSQLQSVGNFAFVATPLTSIAIPSSVTDIGSYAFGDCYHLEEVILQEDSQLTNIGERAFYGCSDLVSFTIPKSVTSIGKESFYGCEKLIELYNCSDLELTAGYSDKTWLAWYAKNVYTPTSGKSNLIYRDDGYVFYNDNGSYYLMGKTGTDTELVLPSDFNGNDYSVYPYAFYYHNELTKVTIPTAVTSLGSQAFGYCEYLENIIYQGSQCGWNEISQNYWWHLTGDATAKGTYTLECEIIVYGDANADDKVDLDDAVLVKVYLANMDYDTGVSTTKVYTGADANADGKVDLNDAVLLALYLANYDYDTGTSSVILGKQGA